MIKYLDNEDYENEIKEGNVIVDFFATWCGPCQMLSPVLEEYSNDRKEVKILKVDVDKHEQLARKFGIMTVPTIFLYKDGKVIKEQNGFVTKEIINSWFE